MYLVFLLFVLWFLGEELGVGDAVSGPEGAENDGWNGEYFGPVSPVEAVHAHHPHHSYAQY